MKKLLLSFLPSSIILIVICCFIATGTIYSEIKKEDVQKRFVNATVVMDKKTGTPSRISGMNYVPKLQGLKTPVTDKNVELVFNAFLDENKNYLDTDSSNVKIVSKILRNGKWFVKYQQHYQGVPIINATIGMVGTEEGKIISYTAAFSPKIQIDTKEIILKEKAIEIAKSNYDEKTKSGLKIRKIEKIIIPIGKDSQQSYHLAWRVDIISKTDRVKNDKIYIIDAKTGKILEQYPSRFYGWTATGKLKGKIYPENPTDVLVAKPLPYANVTSTDDIFNNPTTNTNSNGVWNMYYSSISPWAPWTTRYTANFTLTGLYAHVTDSEGNDYTAVKDCRTFGLCQYTWDDMDPDHINVFYHINKLHNWYKSYLNYNWINPWSNTTVFNAEVNHNYWNAYAGDPMGFGYDVFARSSDVIYHECTHNILYTLYGDWVGFPDRKIEAYAFDEGFADYFASAITDDPLHGEGYGGTRTLDNNNLYTSKNTYDIEGHTGGMIIAGAAWDLRVALQNKYGDDIGAAKADNLIFDGLVAMASLRRGYYFSDPQESNFLSSLYLVADDNFNLLDGVPDFRLILDAFYDHNLLQAVLLNTNSYDVSTNTIGELTGGDFYYSNGKFWANNLKQKGVKDLGNLGNVSLKSVNTAPGTYTRYGVNVVLNHTYAALPQTGEEGRIVFRVTDYDEEQSTVVIKYYIKMPITFDTEHICTYFPDLCYDLLDCREHPEICLFDPVWPEIDGLAIEFQDYHDRIIIPFWELFGNVFDRMEYSQTGLDTQYNFVFDGMPEPFNLAVYDSKGHLVVQDISTSKTKTIKFRGDNRLKYFLIITPTRETKFKTTYKLPIKIAE